jgi:hypothetical protein
MKRGESSKYLRPHHVVPLDITSYAAAESKAKEAVHRKPKPQLKASVDLYDEFKDEGAGTVNTVSSPFSHIASATSGLSPKMSKLADLVEEEMRRIYHSIEVINALMQSMRMTAMEDAKPESM